MPGRTDVIVEVDILGSCSQLIFGRNRRGVLQRCQDTIRIIHLRTSIWVDVLGNKSAATIDIGGIGSAHRPDASDWQTRHSGDAWFHAEEDSGGKCRRAGIA